MKEICYANMDYVYEVYKEGSFSKGGGRICTSHNRL